MFGPNILLSTLFSNTFSLCPLLNVRDQVSHPYRTTGKIITLCIPIFTFLGSRREDKRLFVTFRSKLIFYGEELLAPRPTPKMEDHPLSAVRDWLFNIFGTALHIWRPSPPSVTWGRAMPWWQGTHPATDSAVKWGREPKPNFARHALIRMRFQILTAMWRRRVVW
jgi:hypothetical protein